MKVKSFFYEFDDTDGSLSITVGETSESIFEFKDLTEVPVYLLQLLRKAKTENIDFDVTVLLREDENIATFIFDGVVRTPTVGFKTLYLT